MVSYLYALYLQPGSLLAATWDSVSYWVCQSMAVFWDTSGVQENIVDDFETELMHVSADGH